MTTLENDVQLNEAEASSNGTTENAEAAPTVKYPTYRELAFATWKLAYKLVYVSDAFCSDGANEYLRAFGLPELVDVDGNEELQDRYLSAWFGFTHWTSAGELSDADSQHLRDQLARAIPTRLRRNEPKSRETMNGWLEELGLEPIAPPPPPRHVGRYDVAYNASRLVTSARIREALAAALGDEFNDLNVQVSYVGRIA